METMRYSETKKSSKGIIFFFVLFCLVGGGILYFAITQEPEPIVVGKTTNQTQGYTNVDETEDSTVKTSTSGTELNYEIKSEKITDKSNKKIVSNMTLPVIYIQGEPLKELNETIEKEYIELFSGLKKQMVNAENNFTYTVSYETDENIVGQDKIVSIIISQSITDDAAKKNTMEKVQTYNINVGKKEIQKELDIAVTLLGNDYKTRIRSCIKEYVISNKMLTEENYTYAITGLENFYIKDNILHIIFNEGEIVDKKYGVLDIEITK